MHRYALKQAKSDLPKRTASDSKTRGGKCLIIAGSPGMWGAGLLCARAAARMGAGYVYVYHSALVNPFLDAAPDFLSQSKLTPAELKVFKAAAIGPGLPQGRKTQTALRALARAGLQAVVVDASALGVLAKMKRPLRMPASWILTPHEGELAKLLGVSSHHVRAAREESVKTAQEKFGCVVLLKGHGTLVADSHGVTRIESGNPALAKAGTGDVLTGLIAALLVQGLESKSAACLGAFVHGFIADAWVQSGRDQLSLMASDVIENLPESLAALRGGRPVRKPVARTPLLRT